MVFSAWRCTVVVWISSSCNFCSWQEAEFIFGILWRWQRGPYPCTTHPEDSGTEEKDQEIWGQIRRGEEIQSESLGDKHLYGEVCISNKGKGHQRSLSNMQRAWKLLERKKKKIKELLPKKRKRAFPTKRITFPGIMYYQCSTKDSLINSQEFGHCLRQFAKSTHAVCGIAMLNFCLFIYSSSAYGKHSCASHLHDANPRTPVHCRGERAAAVTPEQGTTVKCCWAVAVYCTLIIPDMSFRCTEGFLRI